MTTTTEETTTCSWRCGDESPGHKHYTVIVREHGKLLGRLAPDGGTVRLAIYASILSNTRAHMIADEINASPPHPGITAKVALF